MDEGGLVTLVFYKLQDRWWREPTLNLIAAACQMSTLTHVELAIGNDAGANGQMTNVCRVFNDSVGVEVVSRTGKNPQYSYLQLGCSKAQEQVMLRYARAQVGKPFSQSAMARSLLFPRETDEKDFYCAELVAAVLKKGGLMDAASNPGAATPESLHAMYRNRAAATGNPTLLRDVHTINRLKGVLSAPNTHERELLIARQHVAAKPLAPKMVGNLRVVAARREAAAPRTPEAVTLTLNSLDMRRLLQSGR
jgi:hypothetical protein